jgi:glycosyltransferase involved in cell wall biosynthesis
VVAVRNAGQRTKIPLSLRFTAGCLRFRKLCASGFDICEFHRVEPALLHLSDPRPKNAFFHQDMTVIKTEDQADILWRFCPWLYFFLEKRIARSLSSAWCVRTEGVAALEQRYSFLRGRVRFVPTWVEPDIFFPMAPEDRGRVRAAVEKEMNFSPCALRLISVGRLDKQKDPHLLISALGGLVARGNDVQLLIVGDGVLRKNLEEFVVACSLQHRVRFLGLRSAFEIARFHQAADCFVLTSAYEGMPIALLEALACGLPVVCTRVGEVRRVVINGVNGQVADARTVESVVAAIERVGKQLAHYSPEASTQSVTPFVPGRVLQDVYENYRRIAEYKTA